MTRILSLGVGALTLASAAMAQLDGPAPLAWRWVGSTSVSPSGSPLVEGNVVFVAVGQRMYALDKDTGNQKWKFPAVEPIAGNFRTEPVAAGDVLVAAADDSSIYAVDPATGEKKWQYISQTPILGQPVYLGQNRVGFACSDNTVMVIDATNGQALWAGPQKIFDGIVGRISGYLGNFLIMTQANDLISVSGVDGKLVWKRNFAGLTSDSRAVVFGDTVYVNSNNFVVALNGISGSFKWNSDAGDVVTYPPAITPTGVAAATRDGHIVFFNPATGRRITHPETDPQTHRTVNVDQVELGSYPLTQPSGIGNVFAFPTTAGTLTMFDSATGNLLWNYTVKPLVKEAPGGSANNSAPGKGIGDSGPAGNKPKVAPATSVAAAGPAVVAGDTILLLARDGSLLAFDRETGVDVTPPTVDMAYPRPGDQVSSKNLQVDFQLDDESSGLKVDSVTISADGKPLDFTLSRDGTLSVHFALAGKNGLLNDGRHVFTINASDWMGNTASVSYSLTIDNTLAPLGTPPPKNNGAGGAGGGGTGIGG